MTKVKAAFAIPAIAIGFGLLRLAKTFELQGDVARATEDTSGALGGHLTALAIDLAAIGCFIFALVMIVRGLRGGTPSTAEHGRDIAPLPRSAAKASVVAEDEPFDADAIMARYLAQRPERPTPTLSPGAFGRKQT